MKAVSAEISRSFNFSGEAESFKIRKSTSLVPMLERGTAPYQAAIKTSSS